MTSTVGTPGRLCNHIIRNICVSMIAERNNLKVEYSYYREIKTLGISLFSGTNIYKNSIDLHSNNFFEILNKNIKSNINAYNDFFQTEEITKIIYYHLQNIKTEIINNNIFKERYNNNNDVFIHIRLSDAEKYNPGYEYYIKVLQFLHYHNIYICSDSPEHNICQDIKKNFVNVEILYYNELDTIKFGSTCKYVILSHGSFSACIGWLSFFSRVFYSEYMPDKIWHGDIFSIPEWNKIPLGGAS